MADADVSQPIDAVRFGRFRTLVDAEFRTSGQVTVVCGPNNSGKSSLLDALEVWAAVRSARRLASLPDPIQDMAQELMAGGISIGLDLRGEPFRSMVRSLGSDQARADAACDWLAERCADGPNGLWWVPVTKLDNGRLHTTDEFLKEFRRSVLASPQSQPSAPERQHAQLLHKIGSGGSSVSMDWFQVVLDQLVPTDIDIRRIRDVRRTSDRALEEDELATLAIAAAPTTDDPPLKKERWARDLEAVLQAVFGLDTRYQAVPIGESQYQLVMSLDGQTGIRVEHVGAGVREVIAIAFTALSQGGAAVLCIEEPENCLHPTAARRLIRALAALTDTQIVVATHSAAVVNSEPDAIIELERVETRSTTRVVTDASHRFRAVRALGHSPADLVLAHSALWVEGPSDRLYLNRWLLEGHGLHEGEDYTVMFYGGASGASVGIEHDPQEELYAQVRPLCRRCVVVADSDRAEKGASRKRHVLRWVREAKGDEDALVLTTPSREIENCAPLDVVNSVRSDHHLSPIKVDRFPYEQVIPPRSHINKAAFAAKVLERGGHLPNPQAEPFVQRLADFIRESRTV